MVEPPHVSDAHLRLDSPSLVLSNQILNDLQKRNAIVKPITRWQTEQQPSIHRKTCSRADAGMLNNKLIEIPLYIPISKTRKFTSETSHSSCEGSPFLSAVDRVVESRGTRPIRLIDLS